MRDHRGAWPRRPAPPRPEDGRRAGRPSAGGRGPRRPRRAHGWNGVWTRGLVRVAPTSCRVGRRRRPGPSAGSHRRHGVPVDPAPAGRSRRERCALLQLRDQRDVRPHGDGVLTLAHRPWHDAGLSSPHPANDPQGDIGCSTKGVTWPGVTIDGGHGATTLFGFHDRAQGSPPVDVRSPRGEPEGPLPGRRAHRWDPRCC